MKCNERKEYGVVLYVTVKLVSRISLSLSKSGPVFDAYFEHNVRAESKYYILTI